jgi:hypothetical protein
MVLWARVLLLLLTVAQAVFFFFFFSSNLFSYPFPTRRDLLNKYRQKVCGRPAAVDRNTLLAMVPDGEMRSRSASDSSALSSKRDRSASPLQPGYKRLCNPRVCIERDLSKGTLV